MSTPRKQKKKAIKPARRDSRASADAAGTPSIFGGSLLSLESRIMFDGAAVATASIVNTEQTAQNQAEDSSSAGNAATTDAPTGEPSATADQALFDALAALDVSAARQDMLFVSTNVLDYQQLLDGISPNVEAHILDSAGDGVEQMADISSNHSSIDPVNLIGDGTEAGMHLSSSFLTQHSISTSYAEQFQQIGQSLSADAELPVYGSIFRQGEAGQLAIDALANLTGADVAASKDRTGHTTESADWLLEVTTGSIETSGVISETTNGAVVGQGNLISGTTVGVQTDNRDNRTIQGNLIGTDAFSTGVASNAFEVQILGNAIYSNTGLGINVEGVSSATANDAPAAADSTIDVISGALAPARVEIVFVDTSVENYQVLIDGIDNPDARVVLLDASRDGMEQIVAALGQVGRVDAIHLISHGNEGELKLGSTVLTGDNMQSEYADELAAIKDHLTDAADILVYGCSFGKGEVGMAAAETLGRLTGADVAASTDATGNAELGGDWSLELQQGSIETNLAVDRDAQDSWSGLLGVVDWDTQTWTAGITTPAVQNLTLADGSTVAVTLTQNAAGTLTSAATSATYTGGLAPAQSALQLGMAINPTTDTITVRVDFSSQPGGSVNNVSMTLFDVDNDEFAVFGSNIGNPTSATVGTTNTFNGTNRVSGNGIDAGSTTGAGNTTVKFNQAGITWVEFTYGSTSNASPIVILHDVLFNSIADVNGPKLDLNDNDAAVSASDNFDDSAPFTAAYSNASGGSIPWASNWIEVDGAGAAQSATAGEVQVVDVDGTAAVDGEVRINRDTGAASSIQRQIDLTNYVNPTLSFNYRTTAGVDAADGIVVEASRDGGVTYTTLSTFTGTAGVISGTRNVSLAGYESANTIIRFRVSAGYTGTAAQESFFVDNVTVAAEPTGFSSSYTEGGAGAAISDTDVVITDANSANMSGGKVSIITNFTAGDTLTFTNVGSVSGSYNSGTGVLTITGTGTIAEYQTFLASVRYSSSSDDPTVGGATTTRIISTIVQDQTTLNPSNMVFSTITITAVNDAPVVDLNAGGAGQDVTTAFTEQTPVLIAPVGTLTDVDSATLTALTVTLTTRPDGNAVESLALNAAATTAASGAGLTVSYTAGTGVLSITGSATKAVYQSILQGILYNDTSDTPTTSNRAITVVANDGATPSATQTVTLTVAAVNDAPVVDLNAGGAGQDVTTAFTEQTPVLIAPVGTLTDVDSATLTALTVTLTTRPDGNAVESLALNAAATTAASGAGLTVSYTAGTGVLSITGSATKAVYQSILQGILYNDTSDTPTTSNRAITVVANDGATPSATQTVTLTVAAVNDAPVVDLNAGGAGQDVTTAFTEQTPVLIAPVGTLTDVDSATLTALTVTLTTRPDGNAVESLALNAAATTAASGAGLTVSYTAGTGVLSITGSATKAVYQSILQGILYNDTSDTPTTSNRAITVVANDGATPSATQTVTLTVAAVNDAPVVDLNAGGAGQDVTTAFTEQTPVLIAPVGTLTDVDSATLTALTVTLTTRPDGNAVESLALNAAATTAASGAGLTVSYTAGTGVLSITGSATKAVYQSILQGILYNDTSDTPTTSNRAITVVANDGATPSATQTVTLTVAAVNDAPLNTVPGAQTVNEDTALSISGLSVTDVDGNLATTALTVGNGTVTVSLAGGATISAGANGTGTLTLAGTQAQINAALASLSYQGNLNFNGTDTLTVVSTDSNAVADTDTVTINVTSVNDAPLNTVPGAQTVNEDTALSISGLSVTDVDGNLATTALTVGNGTVTVSLAGGATISAGANGTGTLTLAGTQAQINAALASLSYQGNLNFNGTDTLTVVSTDSNAVADTDTVTINVTSVNDAPLNTVPGAQTVNEDTALSISGLSVTDVDGNLATTALTVGNGTVTVSLAGGATISAGANGTGTLTLAGTQAQINAALASLSYQGNLNFNGTDTLTVVSTDSNAVADTDTVTINVTSVNDAPLNTVPGAQTVNEDTALSISGLSVTDVDGNLATTALTVGNGTVTVSLAGGATISAGANGTGTLTLAGTQAQINAALASLSYQGNLNFNGTDTLTVVSTDSNAVADTDTVTINVTSVNDAPLNTVPGAQTVNEDTALSISGLSVTDVDGNLATTALTVGNGTVTVSLAGGATISAGANGTGTLTLAGTQAQINAALASLSYQGNLNFNGTDTLTVVSTDSNAVADTDTVTINVTSVNDAPLNTVPGAQTVNEDTALSISGLSVTDVDGNLATTALTVGNGTVTVSLAGGATISAGANGTGTLTLAGTQAQINAALASLSYQGNLNFNGTDTLTVVSTDSNAVADTDTVTINVTSVNDAPLNTVPGAQTVNEDTALSISGLSVTDVDGNLATTALTVGNGTVTVSLAGGATISAGANGTGTLTLAGTQAQINAALASLSYQGNLNFNGTDTLTVVSTDSNAVADTDTVTINVTSVNDAPLNTVPGAQTVNEDTALSISGLSVTDVDGNLATTALTVGNGTVTVSLAGGATISAGANGTGTLTLAGTQAQINAALASLSYQGNLNFNGTDTLTVVSTDSNAVADTDTVTINVTSVNDAPLNTVPGAQTVNEDTALSISGLSVTDVDGNLATTALTVGNGTVTVSLAGGATISAGANGTGTLTLAGTQAQINAALASLSYQGNLNFNGTDTLTVVSTDSNAVADTDTVTINVTSVNDAPLNTVPGAQTVNEDTALSISGLSVTDVDGNLATTALTVGNGTVTVSLAGGATISAGANGTGTLTLAGTQAQINAALASLSYQGNLNFNGTDTLTVVSTDSNAVADTDTVTINVTSVNDAPLNTVPGAQTVNEDTALSISGLSVTDVDGNLATTALTVGNGTVTVSLAGGATISAGANGTGTLTLAGTQAQINAALASLSYQGNLNFNGTDTLTVVSTDSNAVADTDTVTINVTSVNDAPLNTVPGAQTVNEDTALSISGLSVTDVDGNLATTALTVGNGTVTVSLAGGATISAGANGTGTLTLAGTQAQINAALASLSYQGNLNFNGTDTLTVVSTDSNAVADTDTVTINVTSVNDAPLNTVPGAQTVNEDTALSISGLSVTDVDGNLATTALTVGNGTVTVSLAGGATISAGANGTGTLTLAGTQAQINAALASLSYQGNLNFNGTDTLTVVSTDSNAVADTDTVTINVTSVNDAPLNTVPGAQTVNEDTALSISGLSVTDVDGNLATTALTVGNGTVTVSLAGGATISAGANGTGTLTLAGTQAQINAALASLSYQGNLNFNGTDTLTVVSTDSNAVADTDTVTINVTSVNDAPLVDLNAGGAGQNVTTAFTEQTPVLIAPVGTLADVDSATLTSLLVTLTARPDGNAVESLGLNAAATTAASGAGLTVSYTAGTGVLSITGSATTAVYQSILQGILYNDTSNTPTTSNRTINVVANDGTVNSATQTVTLTVAAVNDAPTATITPLTYAATEQTNLTLHGTGLSVADVDAAGATNVIATLSVGEGTLTVVPGTSGVTVGGSGTGSVTLTGSVAQINALLASVGGATGTITYIDNTDTPSASTVLTLSVNDAGNTGGGALTGSDTATINITAVNDAPVVDLNAGGAGQNVTTAFTEQTPALIAPVGTLTDVDSANLSSLRVTLTARPDGNAVESLGLNAAATTAASGAGLTVSYTAGTGVLLITGSATTAVYQSILQGVLYNDTSNTPTTSNRTINVVANDGTVNSATQTVTLTVAAVNDAPVVDLNAGGAGQDVTTAFTEQTPVLIAPVGTLTDVDSATLTSLLVTLTTRPDGNAVESLGLNAAATTAASGAGLTVSYTAGTGVLSITGSATTAVYQSILRGILYNDTSDTPTTSNRTINVVANDGTVNSATQTVTLTVAAVNDAPVVDLNAGGAGQNVTTAFTEQTPVLIAPVGTLADVDSATLTSLRVTLTTRPDGNAVESLGLNAAATTAVSGAGLTVSYTAGTGVLSITGSAATAVYQSILQGILYNDTSNTPTTSNRTINVVANDGTVNSATQTVTLTVAAVNDAPTATNLSAAETYIEDTALNLINIVASDVDSANITATLTLSDVAAGSLTTATSGAVTSTYNALTGVWTASGAIANVNTLLAGVTFTPALNYNSNFTIATSVSDGVAAAITGVKNMTGAAVNDAPVVDLNAGGAGQNVTTAFTEQTPVLIAPVGTLADVDSATLTSLRVTLTARPDGNAVESLGLNAAATTAASGAGLTVSYTAGTGVLSITGSAATAVYQSILQGILYNDTSNTPTTSNRTINVVANDGTVNSATQTVTLTVAAVNDAPTATITPLTYAATEQTNLTLHGTGLSVADVDAAGATNVIATLSVGEGTLTVVPGTSGVTVGGSGTGSVTLTGSVAQINALLASVGGATGTITYIDNTDTPSASTVLTLSVNDAGNTGGGALTGSDTATINITAVNDAPVLGGDATVSVAENTTAVGTFGAVDPDAGDTLTYSLSGADAALFSINAGTGAVSFLVAPDFESGPGPFAITVTATDNGPGSLSDTQNITVNVTNVNEAPVLGGDATVSVAENTTAVGTFGAVDPDAGDTLTYSLSGADAALFSINAGTGAVSFLVAPDFESGPGPFAITVTATDNGPGSLSDTQNITVNVTNVNEAPVLGGDATVSVAENTTAVGTFGAVDPDAGDTLTYSLSGADAALFSINAGTGAVSFLVAPDFESGPGPFAITVTATDNGPGSLSDTQNITVNVTNVNEAPVLGGDATVSVAENTTAVGTFGAVDPDAGDTLTYSLSGADAALFSINAGTGAVSFLVAPDFESGPGPFAITVTATDNGPGSLSDTQNITVNVTNVNEAPVLGGDATVSVAENTTAVGTFGAVDPDAGDTLTYSLSGADAALFSINAGTGAVSFLVAPDFESGPGPFAITVTATDNGPGSLSDTQNITVNVTNVNEAPVLGGDATVSVAENTTAVGTFGAVDPDAGDTLTYSLSGADAALFSINAGTGAVSFLVAPDFESGPGPFAITVTATDNGPGSLSDTQNITVNVTNVNEAPVLGGDATVSVAENTTAVGTFGAVDPDAGDTLTYSLSGADAALFSINAGTGAVSFLVAPDFESGPGPFAITVTATDNGPGSLSDTQNITVNVTNVNEAPVLGGDATVSVAENTTAVGTFGAVDPDAGDTLTYSLSGADAALFSINAGTGAVSFLVAPDFESGPGPFAITVTATDNGPGSLSDTQNITVNVTNVNEAPVLGGDATVSVAENTTAVGTFGAVDPDAGDTLTYSLSGADAALFSINAGTGAVSFLVAPDFESGPGPFAITVTATDNGPGSLSDTQNITVNVTNVNEAPVLGGDATVSVAENTTAVGTFGAVDPDAGDTLTYSLSGADAALFSINAGTGAVSFLVAPDFESGPGPFAITVTATDNGPGSLSDTQNITVNVTNVNEAPVLGGDATVSVAENTTAVGTFGAVDPDAGDTLTYSLSGADAALFSINAGTGAVSFLVAPDFESGPGPFAITVTATDNGPGSLSDTQNITVNVTNVNEAPVLGGDATVSVAENTTAVGTFGAVDPDAGDTLTYSLSGADAALFSINAGTGAVSFLVAPDFESGPGPFAITVTATDNGPGSLSDTQNITVNVTNVNEAPVLGGDATVSVAENTTAVGTFGAVDPDAGDTLTYSLSGADAALFSINAGTGAVSFLVAPDFESGPGPFAITVTATDNGPGSLSDTQNITVNVTNVNEAPVLGGDATVSVAENTTAVGTFGAVDPDAGDTLTYSLSGADAALFSINAGTGAVSFLVAPDFESGPGPFAITVTATDNGPGSLSDTQNITVNVTNVNEAPVLGGDATVSVAENTTAVGTFGAVDPDAGDTLTYSLSGADAALFSINAGTGAVSFLVAPDFESGPGPFAITVTATDNGPGSLSDTQNITVNVTNVNEAPVLGGDATVSVAENTTAVGTFGAVDPDAGDTLTYSLSGADAALFSINAGTGAVSFLVAPDFESGPGPFAITVTATDNGPGSLSDTQNITVNVTNVNEAPVLGGDATVSVAENTTAVGTFGAVDPDAGDTLTYSLSGADAALFSINAGTGAVSFLVAPDFESGPGPFAITVTATDNGPGSLSDTQNITVNVTNVNEAPVAGDDTATTPENTAVTTSNVLANDGDTDSMLSPASITAFDGVSVNGGTVMNNGDGTFTYTPAVNFTGTDTFTYTVSDGVLTDTATVTITVTPVVNSAPTLMTNAGAIVLAGFSDPITSDQLQVTDADNTPAQLRYTVLSAPLNGRLELIPTPGVAITSFTQADINAGQLRYVHNGSASTGDSFTFTVSDGVGGTIGATTFNLTVMPFFPPPLGWPPAPGPASVPFTELPGPPSVGVLMPVLAPSLEPTWSPGRQNPDVVQAKIVDKHDEPAPRATRVSNTFINVEHVEPEDIVPQEPSDLPPDPLSPLLKKVLAVGHNFEKRLTKEADILEQAIEERVIVTALSAGFMVWLLRRGSSLTNSFTSMLGRRKDDEQGNG